ncbi:MAG: hypothetical protein HY303_07465 [Candidatus Wallbacteria bacterium]|nr:hypothetical protein [Candidatus Wallbacteria bacterium]
MPNGDPEVCCLVCGMSLLEERLAKCPECDTSHHQDCWDYNGGCATYGCSQRGSRPPQKLPGKVAPPRPARTASDRWRTIMVPAIALCVLQYVTQNERNAARPVPPKIVSSSHREPSGHRGLPEQPEVGAVWQTWLEGTPLPDAVASPVDDDGPVVVAAQSERHFKLTGLDPGHAQILWTRRFERPEKPSDPEREFAAAVVGNRVALFIAGRGLLQLDRQTGMHLPDVPTGPAPATVEVLGVDHQSVSLGGSGGVLQVDSGGLPDAKEGVAVKASPLPPELHVLGAGRDAAIVQDAELGIALWELGSKKPLWTTRLDRPATTALVRMNYIFVGGEKLWAFDRFSGKLLDAIGLAGPVRRIDERASRLYAMDWAEHLTVFDLDSRNRLYELPNVGRFQYLTQTDFVLGDDAEARVLSAEDGRPIFRGFLSGPRGPRPSAFDRSRQCRLTAQSGHVVLTSPEFPGSRFCVSAFPLPPGGTWQPAR